MNLVPLMLTIETVQFKLVGVVLNTNCKCIYNNNKKAAIKILSVNSILL